MLLSKKTIRTLGFIFTTLALIFAIIAIILAGLTYRYAGPHFRDNPFHAIPQLQISSLVFTFFVLALAYGAFAKPNINFTLAMASLMIISLLWNFAVGVYSIVGGRPGWVNSYVGCKANYNGVMGVFHDIDVYLQEVDKTLCSPDCACYISNITAYTRNKTVAPYYDLWTKEPNNPQKAVNFQNCSETLRSNAYNETVRREPNFDPDRTFNQQKFWSYMARVENDFDCAGWCNVAYYNANYKRPVYMAKYMFSNINTEGPPKYFGCINQLMDWLTGMLQGFGALMICLVGMQTAITAFAFCQYYAREKDHEKQIPHHHDDNRQT